jgi:hypothetical protein
LWAREQAAIDAQSLARDELGFVAGEKRHALRDIQRLSDPSQRSYGAPCSE